MAGREVCVCYLVEILRQGQPKISRHLAYLRKAGVVAARRDGKWMHYRIERPANAAAASVLEAVFESFNSDREMQADLDRLSRACCEPERFVSLQGVPVPIRDALARGLNPTRINWAVGVKKNLFSCRRGLKGRSY
jgi:ArsR family transcriptional regulator